MQFRFNPISQPIDTIPENPSEAKPPVTYDYFHASISMGDKLNTQVKTIVKFLNDKFVKIDNLIKILWKLYNHILTK